jgi:outer membrane protein assembly factor BamD
MAAHVEDARERLIALNRPVPEPTKEQLADSEAEEQSRTGITFKDRALLLVKRGPVTVNAARIGEPTLADAPTIMAPDVNKYNQTLFAAALNNKPLPPPPAAGVAPTVVAAGAAAPGPDAGAPLVLESLPSAEGGQAAGSGPAIGASIVSPGSDSGTPDAGAGAAPRSAPEGAAPAAAGLVNAAPADTGAAIAAQAAGVPGAQNPGGLTAVGPTNNQPLPAIEKPAEAPTQTNDVHTGNAAQVQTGTDAGATNAKSKKKTPAPKYDSSDESSSKHKKKKGLDKLNPF